MAVRYYFNLAPNYAATLTPRVLSKRGLQWQGEFRYLQPKYSGIWAGQYLHNDRKAQFNRWLLDLEHKQRFDFGVRLSLTYCIVSADDYLLYLSLCKINED